MMLLRKLLFAIWVLAHVAGTGFACLLISAFMGLRYDEIHTTSTAFDPDRTLTKGQVALNILSKTASWAVGVSVLAACVLAVNHVLLESSEHMDGKKASKASVALAGACWFAMLACILIMGYKCYMKYGINAL